MRHPYVKWIGSCCLLIGLSLGVSACGVATGGGECTFSEDCAGDEVCYTGGEGLSSSGQCVQQCTDNGECSSGECVRDDIESPEGNSDIGGCEPASGLGGGDNGGSTGGGSTGGGSTGGGSTGGGGGEGCQTNNDCPGDQVCQSKTGECKSPFGGEDTGVPGDDGGMSSDDGGMSGDDATELDPGGCNDNDDCPEEEFCNDMNQCESLGGGGSSYKFVQLREAPDCSGEDEGPDVFGARLEDSSGNTLGWGQVVGTNITASENTNASGVFNGREPSLENQEGSLCPAGGFGSDSVVSLGCSGWMIIGFEQNGNYIDLEAGQTVTVFEYGEQCCATAGACPPEPVGVRTCSGSEGDVIGDDSTCTNDIGVARGQGSFTLTENDLQ